MFRITGEINGEFQDWKKNYFMEKDLLRIGKRTNLICDIQTKTIRKYYLLLLFIKVSAHPFRNPIKKKAKKQKKYYLI